jgi:hypothetical protein
MRVDTLVEHARPLDRTTADQHQVGARALEIRSWPNGLYSWFAGMRMSSANGCRCPRRAEEQRLRRGLVGGLAAVDQRLT